MTPNQEKKYFCKHRNLSFTASEVEAKTGVGINCYNGSLSDDRCKDHGRLCDVILAYQTDPDRVPKNILRASRESSGMAAHNLLGSRGQYGMGNL
jgi:hypothetical protein